MLAETEGGATTKQYTYGDDLLSQTEGAGQERFFLYDGLGTTRVLADGAEVVTDTYAYEAFGELLASTGSSDNAYRYTGEQYDSGLDQYYLRARYYDQGVGRFTQMDTWMGRSQDPITLHKYLYANADPVLGTDPSGQMTLVQQAAAYTVLGGALVAAVHNSNPFSTRSAVSDWDDPTPDLTQIGLLVLMTMVGPNSSLFDLIQSDEPEDKNEGCGRLHGPFYRYNETSDSLSSIASSLMLYGSTPQAGIEPTVQAWNWEMQGPGTADLTFCTPVKPNYAGGWVRWYKRDAGVIIISDDLVAIPIRVLRMR